MLCLWKRIARWPRHICQDIAKWNSFVLRCSLLVTVIAAIPIDVSAALIFYVINKYRDYERKQYSGTFVLILVQSLILLNNKMINDSNDKERNSFKIISVQNRINQFVEDIQMVHNSNTDLYHEHMFSFQAVWITWNNLKMDLDTDKFHDMILKINNFNVVLTVLEKVMADMVDKKYSELAKETSDTFLKL